MNLNLNTFVRISINSLPSVVCQCYNIFQLLTELH